MSCEESAMFYSILAYTPHIRQEVYQICHFQEGQLKEADGSKIAENLDLKYFSSIYIVIIILPRLVLEFLALNPHVLAYITGQ